MKYFKATEVAFKPFIFWNPAADSLAELEALELEADPLILPESEVPDNLYGVCPLKIVSGELVERTVGEMSDFSDEWDIAEALKANVNRLPNINASTFIHDGKEFPMDEVSRLFYHAIDKVRGNQKIMTVANEQYNLMDTTTLIDDFLDSYHAKLIEITKHDI